MQIKRIQSVFNESKGMNERWEKNVIRGEMREENKMKDGKGMCVCNSIARGRWTGFHVNKAYNVCLGVTTP